MCNDNKKERSDAIAQFLEEQELFLDIYRLGSFAEIADTQTANYRIVLLVDNKRGFSYPIVIPWTDQDDPTDLDIILFIKKCVEELDAFHDMNPGTPPAYLLNSGESIWSSRLSDYLPELFQMAMQ